MAAYIVVELDVKDPKGFEPYRQPTAESVTQYGGRFIVRGGSYEVLEGDWRPPRLVVIEFPSMEAAKRWYNSKEYQKVLPIRLKHAESKMLLVNGV